MSVGFSAFVGCVGGSGWGWGSVSIFEPGKKYKLLTIGPG